MSALLMILSVLFFAAAAVLGIIFIVRWASKRPKKSIGIATLVCLGAFVALILAGSLMLVGEMTPEEREAYDASVPAQEVSVNETPAPVESEEDYKATCEEIDWKELARYSEKYVGQRISVTGQVNQILGSGWASTGGCQLYEDYDISTGDTWLQKEWFVGIDAENASPRILENDIVTFYGEFSGTTNMERALTGTTDKIITLKAAYFTIHE